MVFGTVKRHFGIREAKSTSIKKVIETRSSFTLELLREERKKTPFLDYGMTKASGVMTKTVLLAQWWIISQRFTLLALQAELRMSLTPSQLGFQTI